MHVEWISVFTLLCSKFISGDRVVRTTTGRVRGTTVQLAVGKKVEAFLGIPFAEPPVGNLRFQKPIPVTPWEGEYDATALPPPCYQNYSGKFFWTPNVDIMTEDCLYLNVWVPGSLQDTKPKAIFVWIHGGGFSTGSSEMGFYNGAVLANHGNIIVASMNYRLGLFGFLKISVPDAAGNMGIYDQIMAVKWIKANARAFGGDANLITLAGQSAGSMSVALFLVSPLTRGLVKRVILESAGLILPMFATVAQNMVNVAETVARVTGCSGGDVNVTSNPKTVVDCLKNLPPNLISEAEGLVMKTHPITVLPHTDGVLFPRDPADIVTEGLFQDTEVLIGGTKDEGSIFITISIPEYFDIYGHGAPILKKRLTSFLLRAVLSTVGQNNTESIAKYYIERASRFQNETNDDVDYMKKALYDSLGDFFIFCPTMFQADFMSTQPKPVYFYLYTHRSKKAFTAEWMGVIHFAEVPFVFGLPLKKDERFTEEDEEISRLVMDRWIAFVKTGNPNIPGEVEWPPYKWYDPVYLDIGVKQKVGKRPDNYRCEFWRDRFGASMGRFKTEAITNKAPREKSFYILVITYFLFVKTLTK